ncbi:uncharacterized protein LOC112694569 [Sipha flava]|jgi:hypothetical protein|uniref:Uncharacterized protein LOC112694569 n=1 Tax=Sipha flava TaxID=143950 RepID=A0A2S2Q6I1_9HEMI|nr:uncharacterized protein LOC112694569 [Sipha flava]XP_025425871.1 uncharacterized protein LOC112694569 [Sipha flava]
MNIREVDIMNNKALISVIFLDLRYKITLTEEQSMEAIKHLINLWIHMKMLEKKHQELIISDKDVDNLSDISCDSKSSDEIEQFLKANYLQESFDQNQTNLSFSNSQKFIISTQIEKLLKPYHIEQNRI